MNITPENVLHIQHQEWLKHPVTQQLISNLDKYRKHVNDKISISTFDRSVPDYEIRQLATVVNTTNVLQFMISNTQEFVGQSKK